MKLITEYIANSVEPILEESENGEKKLYIQGIFMQGGIPNGNGREYPESVLDAAVKKYIKEQVETNGAIGELNHPSSPIPDPKQASHRIVKLWKEGKDWMGKALVLNTTNGREVRGLLEGDVRLGVSSRGLGTVKARKDGINEVQNDFVLSCVDIVSNPSAPNAFVNGIMESKNYMICEGKIIETIEEKSNKPSKVDAIINAMKSLT